MPEIRAFRAGDENGIRRLFETCHRRPLEADVWRWRYASRPHGAPVTDVAVEEGEIVGHVSALPVRLERGNEAFQAGLWVDLMIAPRHRNLALFLDMAEANRRRCAEAGVELLFAFPNDKSYPVLKRMLGWQDLGDIAALEGSLDALRRPTGGSKAERVDAFTPEFGELTGRLRPPDRLCAARDADHLNWRYRGRPRANYPSWSARATSGRLEGFLVAKLFDGPLGRVGDILDFRFEPGAAESLLTAALDYFKSERVTTVSAWAFEGTPQRGALENCGLAPGTDRAHFAGRWTAETGPAFPARHIDWALFKGDSDVF